MKILTVVGARPQFIKAAAVSRKLKEFGLEEIILHTGQHFDQNMSQVFFDEMEIPVPNYNLNINSLNHGAMTGRMLEGIEQILLKEEPNLLMVYGDTNSTIAGALAAQKLHIPVAHVEAGLRSFNMAMPEEINRILTDRISNYLFCPTQTAVQNLTNEGFQNFSCRIENTGDVMQDAAMYYGARSAEKSKVANQLNLNKQFVLATFHRQENTDDAAKLRSIIESLNKIHSEMQVIVPLHPRTKKIVASQSVPAKFTVIDPVGYFDMVELLKRCALVITDSGGLQKEAFFFQKPCVTMRAETEWTELVENGVNILANPGIEDIYESWRTMLSKNPNFSVNLYGNGKASERIAGILANM
ncbi:MAG TPA: UDP-N-acetylglucosamine 2-epimerase (non-hydrolyzing) [Tenuifilaceae bacterium]|nr:UDP-N-acetylglucosamine 2-epimerase (non-hydrolyzing) [Tenuifilaceae bacterium]HPE18669.1 UDP-N-acetylglucosamine 2-epimerase (non-hydrolyzing) [Tenuifilaceae bacterium]HRX67998.1 UDP-N-acetylglucosamine 2-epimerase (non-hydrolyzing) [Tenuifilaceae bacterium]